MSRLLTLPQGTLLYGLRAMGVGIFVFCLITAPTPCMAMEVTPIVESAPVADLTPSDPWQRNSGRDDNVFPPPVWTSGNPLPEREWDSISRRPWAFGPIPMRAPTMTTQAAASFTGAISPALPRISGPDPAAMPMQSLRGGGGTSKAPKQPAMTSTSTTITSQGVTIPKVASPTVPGVAVPTVSSPTVPTVSTPASPNGVKQAQTAVNPYSATASPTGPVTPTAPTVPVVPAADVPSMPPVQSTPAAAPAASPAVPPAVLPNTTGNGNGTGDQKQIPTPAADTVAGADTAAGSANTGVTGVLQQAPAAPLRQRAPVIGGPAESLVIPPAGINLTPNNGAGALTSQPVSK